MHCFSFDIETVPGFKKKAEPQELFSTQFPKVKGLSQIYDYDPGNDRFLIVKVGDVHSATKINVVLNFIEELKRLDPANKN